MLRLCLLFSLLLIVVPQSAEAANLSKIRFSDSVEQARLVLEVDSDIRWQLLGESEVGSGQTHILLPGTKLRTVVPDLKGHSGLFKSMQIVRSDSGKTIRLIVRHQPWVKTRHFKLPDPGGRMRLVVDFSSAVQPLKMLSEAAERRPVLIAIDAGHGGIDPGAVSSRKIKEKDLVLKIASLLQQLFLNEVGYHPIMTRYDDRLLSFSRRLEIARSAAFFNQHRQPADLFVSIHADSFTNSSASGASVFALSPAKINDAVVVHMENKAKLSPLQGRVNLEEADREHEHLAEILLDLSLKDRVYGSFIAGPFILDELAKITRLHQPYVKKAGFAVLKPSDIPSLLIETGFLSNAGDERNLNSHSFRVRIATAIFIGIKKYFTEHPPPGTLRERRNDNGGIRTDTRALRLNILTQQGDNLAEISRRYGIRLKKLKQLNGLQNNTIKPNITLRIPLE